MGEAHLILGDTESAIKSYKKSLELNPQNANATEQLKRLKKQKK
jgi:Tfp pilus assembly protein PilF